MLLLITLLIWRKLEKHLKQLQNLPLGFLFLTEISFIIIIVIINNWKQFSTTDLLQAVQRHFRVGASCSESETKREDPAFSRTDCLCLMLFTYILFLGSLLYCASSTPEVLVWFSHYFYLHKLYQRIVQKNDGLYPAGQTTGKYLSTKLSHKKDDIHGLGYKHLWRKL